MNRSATVIIESLSSTDITNYVSDIWMDIFIPCLTTIKCIDCKKTCFSIPTFIHKGESYDSNFFCESKFYQLLIANGYTKANLVPIKLKIYTLKQE